MNRMIPDISKEKFCRSWSSAVPGFEKILSRIREAGFEDSPECARINYNSGKTVWRCQTGGFDFAYKIQEGKKPWRYFFRSSLPVRECKNYRILAQLDIKVPDVLAVGDVRKFFKLKESFLVTSFLQETRDGNIFRPGREFYRGAEELKRAFCEEAMRTIAAFHSKGYYHKAFHARNLLFRGENAAELELFWIDVARPRKNSLFFRKRHEINDLHVFFRDMVLPRSEVLDLLKIYAAGRQDKKLSAEKLFNDIVKFRRRLIVNSRFMVFDETND